jgi:phosphoribosylformylglycinamidine synthase
MKAEIQITLNKAVLDPQGQAVLQALHRLGFTDAQNVRVGKVVHLDLENQDPDKAVERLNAMSEKLLANPVMEDFHVKLVVEDAS